MKKLIALILFALLASACGGDSSNVEESTVDDAATTEQSSSDTDASSDPIAVDPNAVEEAPRDCVRSTRSGEREIELPPAEKPPVSDEFLVAVDELITTDLIEGTGPEAQVGATVSMQYVGVLAADGTEFDASWNRNAEPFAFALGAGQVINGWDEGIVGMKVGGRRVLQIPSAQAYGSGGSGGVIGADADLVFIVDLIGTTTPQDPPPVPQENLGAVAGGLQIVDLVEGDGCIARSGDIISVNYVGVDALTGEEFDSSWRRGDLFDLTVSRSQVIDGWNEGIEGMRVGGERILQIPSDDAYGEGDLVFRVHLEELIDAPLAHQLTFQAPAPTEVQTLTLREGSGDGATTGDQIETRVAVVLHNSNVLAQSSWAEDRTVSLALTGSSLPGLEENLEGIKEGELRQIILPAEVAYPNGIPPQAGIEADDALVFIVEVVSFVTS